VITACLGLIKSTSSCYDGESVAIDSEREFYRLQGDLYSLCRVKASGVIPQLICLA
jgi:trafficking protein particle complex subunit 10